MCKLRALSVFVLLPSPPVGEVRPTRPTPTPCGSSALTWCLVSAAAAAFPARAAAIQSVTRFPGCKASYWRSINGTLSFYPSHWNEPRQPPDFGEGEFAPFLSEDIIAIIAKRLLESAPNREWYVKDSLF